jgi:hypothetical protein
MRRIKYVATIIQEPAEISRNRVIGTGLTKEELGFNSRPGLEILYSSQFHDHL